MLMITIRHEDSTALDMKVHNVVHTRAFRQGLETSNVFVLSTRTNV